MPWPSTATEILFLTMSAASDFRGRSAAASISARSEFQGTQQLTAIPVAAASPFVAATDPPTITPQTQSDGMRPDFVLLGRVPSSSGSNASEISSSSWTTGASTIEPSQMVSAYGVNQITFNGVTGTGLGQTIALIEAYNDPDIISDANTFSQDFNLPQFNGNGEPTLTILNQKGGTSLPQNDDPGGWDVEESLDVEWAHTIAPMANIVVFEADSNYNDDLYQAVTTAAAYPNVSVVSMSFGSNDFFDSLDEESTIDSTFATPAGHQGVTFLASTADDGAPSVGYPALSPNVVAVGGTELNISSSGAYISESAWDGGGGGVSEYESPQPSFQSGSVNGANPNYRTVPDVSMDADENTGVDVLDSFYNSADNFATGSLIAVGGTSLSTPMWAGLMAIVNQGRSLKGESSLDGPTQTLPMLYHLPSSDFHDITKGNNGYPATPGYDLATGLGSPVANLLVPDLAGYNTASRLAFDGLPGDGTSGDPLGTFTADVEDQPGNVISTSDSIQISIASGPSTQFAAGSTTTVTAVDGVATFSNLVLDTPGLYTFTVHDATTSGVANATSVSVNILPTTAWTDLTSALPNDDGAQLALLMPNGTILVHGGSGQDGVEWYQLTPDSTGSYADGTWTQISNMNAGRLYFGSAVLPNGDVFVVGGDFSTAGADTNTAEIYNPVTNIWTSVASDPVGTVGHEPVELLQNGNILVGDLNDDGTEIYDPTTNTWTTGPTKVHESDTTDAESWVKLPDGSILAYDVLASVTDNEPEAERYVQSTNTWVDASNGNLPFLSDPGTADELGPALLLPSGLAFFTGSNGLTAYYNPKTNSWTQGPTMPVLNGVQLTTGHAPGAVLPNGDVLLALSPAVTPNDLVPPPTYLYEFNPATGVYTNVTPTPSQLDLSSNSYVDSMLVLPNGQVMVVNDSGQTVLYTPPGNPNPAWRPQISSFTNNNNGTYTLTGTQINGLDEGASSGNVDQMAENYPIVQVTDTSTGKVYYATTSNWSSTGVATGNTPETVTVVLPSALGNDSYTLVVIADGIASDPIGSSGITLHLSSVTAASTTVNTQTTSGLVITPASQDAATVTEFQITNIAGGTLYLNNGVTQVTNGEFITKAQAAAGLKFTPANNSLAPGSFDVQEATGTSAVDLGPTLNVIVPVSVVLNQPVVTNATTTDNQQTTSGLVITPNAADTPFVSYFQITDITGGTLYLGDGVTPVVDGDFISVAQGAAGLKFTPAPTLWPPAALWCRNRSATRRLDWAARRRRPPSRSTWSSSARSSPMPRRRTTFRQLPDW